MEQRCWVCSSTWVMCVLWMWDMGSTVNKIVRMTKLYSEMKFRYTETHWKCHTDNLVLRLQSNKTKAGPLRAFTLVGLSHTATEQPAESKAENVYIACHFDSIQQKLWWTSWWMWLCTVNFYFLNHFQSTEFIPTIILCNAVCLYSFL
jgi:hypothetical protein